MVDAAFYTTPANRRPHFAAALFGGPGSGKTHLMGELLAGVWARATAPRLPVAILDPEGTAKQLKAALLAKGLGEGDVLVRPSAELADLVQVLADAAAGKFCAVGIDGANHFWEGALKLAKEQLELVRRSLSPGEQADTRAWWHEHVSAPLREVPCHLVLTARAGAAWGSEVDADTQRRERFRGGLYMRGESDTGYETDLVVRLEHADGSHRAIVEKSRLRTLLTGREIVAPTFESFAEAVEEACANAAAPVSLKKLSPPVLFFGPKDTRRAEAAAIRKQLMLEEQNGWLALAFGAGESDKAIKGRARVRETVYGSPAPSVAKTYEADELYDASTHTGLHLAFAEAITAELVLQGRHADLPLRSAVLVTVPQITRRADAGAAPSPPTHAPQGAAPASDFDFAVGTTNTGPAACAAATPSERMSNEAAGESEPVAGANVGGHSKRARKSAKKTPARRAKGARK